jgi:hypothetical protein
MDASELRIHVPPNHSPITILLVVDIEPATEVLTSSVVCGPPSVRLCPIVVNVVACYLMVTGWDSNVFDLLGDTVDVGLTGPVREAP